MPADTNVWIILIIAVAVAALAALYLGRKVNIRKNKDEWSIKIKDNEPKKEKTSVGEGLDIVDSTIGNITGRESVASLSEKNTDVLKKAKIKGSVIGDIVGEKQKDNLPKEKS